MMYSGLADIQIPQKRSSLRGQVCAADDRVKIPGPLGPFRAVRRVVSTRRRPGLEDLVVGPGDPLRSFLHLRLLSSSPAYA